MNKVTPTAKQAKAMQLIREGVKPTIAMREAGYAASTSEAPSEKLVRSAGAKTIIEQQLDAYARIGITQEFLADKTAEWITAQKIDHSHTEPDTLVPDYQTQLKAADMVREDMGLKQKQTTLQQFNANEMNLEFIANDESSIT